VLAEHSHTPVCVLPLLLVCHCRADEEDHHYGIRMCVGGKSDWTGASIGGIATLNSFGWINKPDGPVYRDSFVFSRWAQAASMTALLIGNHLGVGYMHITQGLHRHHTPYIHLGMCQNVCAYIYVYIRPTYELRMRHQGKTAPHTHTPHTHRIRINVRIYTNINCGTSLHTLHVLQPGCSLQEVAHLLRHACRTVPYAQRNNNNIPCTVDQRSSQGHRCPC